ncbi:hypothetical protein CBC3_p0017 (plasmid) [Clostridium botulinum V891]|nr:hypothetical protein CBC3_p0017 [Clostridium botulinum V891]
MLFINISENLALKSLIEFKNILCYLLIQEYVREKQRQAKFKNILCYLLILFYKFASFFLLQFKNILCYLLILVSSLKFILNFYI